MDNQPILHVFTCGHVAPAKNCLVGQVHVLDSRVCPTCWKARKQ